MGLLEDVPRTKDVRSVARGFGSDVANAAGKAVAVAGKAATVAGKAVAVVGKAIEKPARTRAVRAVSFSGGE